MKAIWPIIHRKGIFLSPKRKTRFADPVAIAADYRAEKGAVFHVAVDIIISENYVVHFSRPVRSKEGSDDAAEIRDAHFHTDRIGQHI